MCITIPAKVISALGSNVLVEVNGKSYTVYSPFETVAPNQWVLVSANLILQVVPESEAHSLIELFNDLQKQELA